MFRIFQEEKVVSVLMGLFLVWGILTRLVLGFLYQKLIKDTENMASTKNRQLKQCKVKFFNCYQLNKGVSNVSVFVDKFLNSLSIGPIPLDLMYHLSGQLTLLSVVCSGIGVCKSIVSERRVMQILPFYIVSFAGLYIYFSVSAVVDIKGKRRVLKVNLVDYLENHLSARIDTTDKDLEMLYGEDISRKRQQRRETGNAALGGAGVDGGATQFDNRGEADAAQFDRRRQADAAQFDRRGEADAAQSDRRRQADAAQFGKNGQERGGFSREQEKELEELLADFMVQ